MADLANPLPVIVIAEMLGVSTGDHEQFKAMVERADLVISSRCRRTNS